MNELLYSMALPVIVAFFAALPGIFAYATERSRIKAERERTALEAYQRLYEPLQDRVSTLEQIVGEQDVIIQDLKLRNQTLEKLKIVLERDLDGAQHLVTAYLGQLIDAEIQPNPVYIQQTRNE